MKYQSVIYQKYLFGGNREAAIQRDSQQCVRCGMTRDEHKKKFGRDITVDHIDDNGLGKRAANKNNNIENLQTLCIPCHSSKDNRLRKITEVQAINIRHMRGELSQAKIAALYGITEPRVWQIITNYRKPKEKV